MKQPPFLRMKTSAIKRINKMPPDSAKQILELIGKINGKSWINGNALDTLVTRCLTGGYWSQSLSSVMRQALLEQSHKKKEDVNTII